jgi:hypothetical protein
MMNVLKTSRRGAAVLALLYAAPACHTSPDPADAAHSSDNRGVYGVVEVGGTAHYAELLSISDSMLVVLRAGDRVTVVPVQPTGVRVSFAGVSASSYDRTHLTEEEMRRARAASRFPYGITPEAMRALLAYSRQAAPDTLRPPAP